MLVFQTIQAVATLSLPTLNANIIDNGALKGDTSYIWKVGAVMLAVTLVQVCFAVAATFYGARSAMGFGRDVRRDLFHTVMGYSAREVGQFGAPSLITRITNDVTQVQVFVLMTLTLFVTAPIMIIGGVIFAVREDGPLSLILLVAVPILLLSVGQVALRMHPQFTKMQNRIDRVNQVLREQISGMRVVRAFVREPDEAVRFGTANADLTETSLKTGRMMAVMFPAVLLTINISSVAAVWFGADRIDAGQMQVGSLVAFLSYLIQILMAVMMSTFVLMMGPRASVCAGRIQEVLQTSSSVVNPTDGVTELPGAVSLELRHAEFAFPGAEQPVLHDLNFRVEAGQTLAIIGSTGSGKTALLNLIARYSTRPTGRCSSAGSTCASSTNALVERLIGFVPQKPFLFSGTVATNVRFGNQDATDAEVWEALEVAQARDFVEAKPDQLDAPIAQGGTNVSGGQRQRLAIARALAHKPAIYLFDDSFSALDLATDAPTRAALPYRSPPDAVTVVVAQRVSTIVRADQILVLEEGRIVGLGTHRELLESCPTYQEIVESAVRRRGGGGVTSNGTERHERQRHGQPEREGAQEGDRGDPRRRPAGGGERGHPLRRRHAGRAVGELRQRGPAPPAAHAGRSGLRVIAVLVLAVVSVTLTVIGPRILGHATNIIVEGIQTPAGIDFAALHKVLLEALFDLRRRRAALVHAELRPRRGRAAFHAQATPRRRGQAQPAADRLHRQPTPWRPAEPRHQRHRQRRAEPPTDAQHDAHVDAHDHRRRHHDDLDLAACWR